VRCDIINNQEYGIWIEAPELLVVESCNVRGNGAGIVVHADALHEDSRISASNVFENGDSLVQVETYHQHGTLDISGNYWAQISDPELSASWDRHHEDSMTCRGSRTIRTSSSSQPDGNTGPWRCTWQNRTYSNGRYTHRYSCTYTQNVDWESPVSFTGFSPVELSAGPDLENYVDQVQQERQAQGL
jgi:hypothetical protein